MARSERPSKKKTSSFGKRSDAEKNFLNKRRDEGRKEYDSPKRSFSRDRDNSSKPSRYGKPDERKSFGKRNESPSDRSGGYSKPFEKRVEGGDKPFRRNSSRPFGESRSFEKRSEPRSFSKSPYPKKEEGGRPFGKRVEGFDTDKPKRIASDGDEKNFRGSSRPFDEPNERPKKFSRDQVVKKTSFVESKIALAKSSERPAYKEKTHLEGELIRLNKFVANSGVCSRREADEFIKMGLVTVNGVAITEMGHKVKITDDVRYEGKKLKAEKPVYVLLNKPKGFITTTSDPEDRNTVMNLVANVGKERIYPVGRLDRNTTGLLLLTNDGELADKLTHPSYKAKKIYKVELDKPITKSDFQKVQEGVYLEEGRAIVDDLAIVSDDDKTIGIELHIGWNRIVRRIFESLGYEVMKLDRVVYAGLDKKELSRGQWRFLKPEEVVKLKHFSS
jgi:23S rRNA pseudouridine2605 synthase